MKPIYSSTFCQRVWASMGCFPPPPPPQFSSISDSELCLPGPTSMRGAIAPLELQETL